MLKEQMPLLTGPGDLEAEWLRRIEEQHPAFVAKMQGITEQERGPMVNDQKPSTEGQQVLDL